MLYSKEQKEELMNGLSKYKKNPVIVTILSSENEQLKERQTFNLYEADKVFEKLKNEQQNQVASSNSDSPYNYSKVKINVIETEDGTTMPADFNFGDNNYNNVTECIKSKFGYDLNKYLSWQLEKSNIKENVIKTYANAFPAIKHITEKSALVISNLNKMHNHVLSVNEIKELYKDTGKKIESGSFKIEDRENFNDLKSVLYDFKKAQITEKQAQAHENVQSQKSSDELSKCKSLSIEPEL